MQQLRTTSPTDEQWDAFVAAHHQAHILQTSRWGELKNRFGWSVGRAALADPCQTIVAGAQILYRRLPFGLGTLAYVPKGPILDWQDVGTSAQLAHALAEAACTRGALALTIEPNLTDSAANAELLTRAGFAPGAVSFQPRRTLLVDIAPDEANILSAMKSKTRYNLRLSARKGVTVRQGTSNDVTIFNQLMSITGARNQFGVRSAAYHRTAFELFDPVDQIGLFLAEYDGEPLAGVMVFALQETAWYFFGASSDAHRNLMAPYAVQWMAMQWAKGKGCKTYDLWGVPDEDEDILEEQFTAHSEGLWGVYRFKRGFGGRLTRSIGAWDRVFNPLRYRLYRWLVRLR